MARCNVPRRVMEPYGRGMAEETHQEHAHAMSNLNAFVAKGQEGFNIPTLLIDKSLLRTVEWITDETEINAHRTYVGRTDAEPFVKWQHIEVDRGRDYRRAIRRGFGQELPRHEVSFRILRVIYEFTSRSSDTGTPTPFLVILKDTDADDDVREALQDARAKYANVVVGMQHTEFECWLIAGFEPQSADESSRLAEICRGDHPGVGFDPRPRSEALTATKREHEKLSPKRVLKQRTSDNRSRALNGIGAAPHQLLKDRGKGNGLMDFLADVERLLVRQLFAVIVTEK